MIFACQPMHGMREVIYQNHLAALASMDRLERLGYKGKGEIKKYSTVHFRIPPKNTEYLIC